MSRARAVNYAHLVNTHNYVQALAQDLQDRARGRDFDPGRNRALIEVHALDRFLDLACARAHIAGNHRDLSGDLSRLFARLLKHAHDAVQALDLERERNFDRDCDRDHDRALVLQARIVALHRMIATGPPRSGWNGIVVAGTLSRLTAWAVRLVPPAYRGEYEEEFRSELYEVAAGGAGWWGQVRHCLRVLARTPLLRRELLTSTPSARERSW